MGSGSGDSVNELKHRQADTFRRLSPPYLIC